MFKACFDLLISAGSGVRVHLLTDYDAPPFLRADPVVSQPTTVRSGMASDTAPASGEVRPRS